VTRRYANEAWPALRRTAALALAIVVCWVLFRYPFHAGLLAAGLCLYGACIRRYPSSWVFFITALLPVLDLAPMSGWFFLDEFDLFVMTTWAVALWGWRGEGDRQGVPKGAWVLLGLFVVSYAVSAIIGLLPLEPIDFNAFSNYFSRYNSLRIAKGFLWALTLIPLLIKEAKRPEVIQRNFILGMLTGLSGVVMVALWERQVFSGLLNFSNDFRITSTFSGMHTGGAYIDVYLVMALPFIASCFLMWRKKVTWCAGLVLFGLGLYTLLVTFSRVVYVAFFFSWLTLLAGFVYRYPRKIRLMIIFPVLAAITVFVTKPVLNGVYMQDRFAKTANDVSVRLNHWMDAVSMMDSNWKNELFGMGLGSYPRTYAKKNTEGVTPTLYSYLKEGDTSYLRLISGDSLYMGQRLCLIPDKVYTLSADLRGYSDRALLTVPVCEKSLLYSYRCNWLGMKVGNTGGHWVNQVVTFRADGLGKGRFYQRRPVDLALYNGNKDSTVDVTNVQLNDENGTNLIKNGNFSAGNDRWFFSTDNHLPWHVKNLWVHIYFEQGWIGLLTFCSFVAYVVTLLVIGMLGGDMFSLLLLSSVVGFFSVGLIDSLVDSPRISMLFFLLMFIALICLNRRDDAQRFPAKWSGRPLEEIR
jgi:hypothetical protein